MGYAKTTPTLSICIIYIYIEREREPRFMVCVSCA
jgi:hypothetical protein